MKANKRAIAFKMFDEGKTLDEVSKTLLIKRASGHYYLYLWKSQNKAVKKTAPKVKRSQAITALVTPMPPQTPESMRLLLGSPDQIAQVLRGLMHVN